MPLPLPLLLQTPKSGRRRHLRRRRWRRRWMSEDRIFLLFLLLAVSVAVLGGSDENSPSTEEGALRKSEESSTEDAIFSAGSQKSRKIERRGQASSRRRSPFRQNVNFHSDAGQREVNQADQRGSGEVNNSDQADRHGSFENNNSQADRHGPSEALCRLRCQEGARAGEGQKCFNDDDCQDLLRCDNSGRCTRLTRKVRLRLGQECVHDEECSPGLVCFLQKCDSPGREEDYCRKTEQCRNGLYCSTSRRKCQPRRSPGSECRSNKYCLNSLCLRPQGLRTRKRYCAVIGSTRSNSKSCNPKSQHCSGGMVCKKQSRPVSPPRELLGNNNNYGGYQDGYDYKANTRSKRQAEYYGVEPESTEDNDDYDDYYYAGPPPPRYKCVQPQPSRNDAGGSRGKLCARSAECGCGEYCSRVANTCKKAVCYREADCPRVYNLPSTFRCNQGQCVPSELDLEIIFNSNATSNGTFEFFDLY